MSKNQCTWHDMTYHCDVEDEWKALRSWMMANCKEWGFQWEQNGDGSKHYQIRVALKKKRRSLEIKAPFKWHVKPTVKKNIGEWHYLDKEDTRINGPWKHTDLNPTETKQMLLMKKWGLYPWQQTLLEKSSNFCLRTIDMIYDPTGNCGKSLFSEYMEYNGLAEEVPPYRLMDDLFQWVHGMPTRQCYIFDMPRGMKKDKLGDFYSGIEVIKNGVAFDKRHYPKKKRFSRPRIFVFTNTLPDFDLMSHDRWNVWTINQQKELITYVDLKANCVL